MSELEINITFNARPSLRFVQGEDRTISVALRDCETGNPIDLTGYEDVCFAFPAQAGGSIRRHSGPFLLQASSVASTTPFTLLDHGLVTGDPVRFSSAGTLPAPLAPATTYLVVVTDANTFTLTDASGNAIAIAAAPIGPFTMAPTPSDVTVASPPTSGLVTLGLRALVTAAIGEGSAQSLQAELTDAAGHKRIAIAWHQLDVYLQVTP